MYRPLLASSALVCLLATALADVNVAVRNGDRVFGTFNPAGETETLRVFLPAGAKLTVTAKGKKNKARAGTPTVGLQVFAEDDEENTTPLGTDRLKATKTGAKLRGWVVPESGIYRLVLTGDGQTVGDYLAKVKWKSPRVFKIKGDTTDDDIELTFHADPGSTAKFIVQRAGGKAVPRLDNVFSIEGDLDEDFDFPDNDRVTTHKASLALPDPGEYLLTVTDDGFDGGKVSGKVVIKAPKPAKRNIEITTDQLGASPTIGGDLAVGEVFGKEGGELDLFEFTEGALEDVFLLLPPDALDLPTAIIAGSAPEVQAPEEEELQGAGPSVFFGPEGTVFNVPVEVTIPLDPDAVDDPADVRVVQRDADGTRTIIDPEDDDVDTVGGTVTFPTSHFTAFRAFVPARPVPKKGDLDGNGTAELFVRAPSAEIGDGAVHIFSSATVVAAPATLSTAAADFTVLPEQFSAELGTVLGFGDFNRDGRGDVVMGAPGAGDGGEVYVFFGSSSFDPLDTADADVTIGGPTPQRLGTSIAVGDFNGDGTDDIAIGAPETDAGAGTDQGTVYVFFGGSGLVSANAAQANVVLTGEAGDDLFGRAVAALDIDGDGSDDLAVGAPQIEAGSGNVYLFVGGSSFSSTGAASANSRVSGTSTGDQFGKSLAVGNVNGAGPDDLIVGSPGFANGPSPGDFDAGAVYVFAGGSRSLGTTTTSLARLVGTEGQDQFGEHVQAGDLNDDNVDDVIVGAPFAFGTNLSQSGVVYVYNGGTGITGNLLTTSASFTISAPQADTEFGTLQQPLDVSGDGVADLAVYAPLATEGVISNGGALYLFFGGSTFDTTVDLRVDGQDDEFLGGGEF